MIWYSIIHIIYRPELDKSVHVFRSSPIDRCLWLHTHTHTHTTTPTNTTNRNKEAVWHQHYYYYLIHYYWMLWMLVRVRPSFTSGFFLSRLTPSLIDYVIDRRRIRIPGCTCPSTNIPSRWGINKWVSRVRGDVWWRYDLALIPETKIQYNTIQL